MSAGVWALIALAVSGFLPVLWPASWWPCSQDEDDHDGPGKSGYH